MGVVIADTEYTTWPGALEGGWSEPGQHREIIQIAAVFVDGDFSETASFDVLVRPAAIPVLSPLTTGITGIRQSDLDGRGLGFAEALARFRDFCGGAAVVCMNADEAVFRENCSLSGIGFPFGDSWRRLRPFLRENGVDVAAVSSGDLHRLTRRPIEGRAHDALHDVRGTARWLSEARADGVFRSLDQLPAGAPDVDPRSAAGRGM